MQQMFEGEVDFGPTTINAIVRLFKQMDEEMYDRWSEKRWRHFLPTDFSVRKLNKIYYASDNTMVLTGKIWKLGKIGTDMGFQTG